MQPGWSSTRRNIDMASRRLGGIAQHLAAPAPRPASPAATGAASLPALLWGTPAVDDSWVAASSARRGSAGGAGDLFKV